MKHLDIKEWSFTSITSINIHAVMFSHMNNYTSLFIAQTQEILEKYSYRNTWQEYKHHVTRNCGLTEGR